MTGLAWMDQALCAKLPDWLEQPPSVHAETCRYCPVRWECAAYGARLDPPRSGDHGDDWPIYGGVARDERRPPLTRTPASAPRGRRTEPIQHGTDAGYQQHQRRGDGPCPECFGAHRDRMRQGRRGNQVSP